VSRRAVDQDLVAFESRQILAVIGLRGIRRSWRRLKRDVFGSIVELQAAIDRFLQETNDYPKRFIRTANPETIFTAGKRGQRAAQLTREILLSCSAPSTL
jgi:hypothetical protein